MSHTEGILQVPTHIYTYAVWESRKGQEFKGTVDRQIPEELRGSE